ncbi:MAG: DUF1460 domain-containing protein [Lewinellaceae bacterium]|nr:DUF1460 domain-containing protein [Saprospiraceae bacterium]MCB9317608.1 DUF1460 domain-containing protein [Lewinellaceae bacterium]MCB9334390.1 DUF1460 domain-containing protein [Lewinellaceae bacterium]
MRLLIGIGAGLLALGTVVSLHGPVALTAPNRLAVLSASAAIFPDPDPQDYSIFKEKIPVAQAESTLPAQTLAVAKSFLGTPYVSGTLESKGPETLTINLQQLDCWTFMENSLALALAARTTAPSLDSMQYFVQKLRYWGGAIDGYASRMHYFTGWLLQAEKSGYLKNITRELGGIPYRKKIGYMSARPQKYPELKDPAALQQIRQVEQRLNAHDWFFIPQEKIARIEPFLQDGDLIALTSWKKDLDISHQGFAIRKNGHIHLLHASSLGKRVLISGQPLAQYVRSQKGQTGIMVARLK